METLNEDEKLNCQQKMLEIEQNVISMQHHEDHHLNWLKYQEPHIQELFQQKTDL